MALFPIRKKNYSISDGNKRGLQGMIVELIAQSKIGDKMQFPLHLGSIRQNRLNRYGPRLDIFEYGVFCLHLILFILNWKKTQGRWILAYCQYIQINIDQFVTIPE